MTPNFRNLPKYFIAFGKNVIKHLPNNQQEMLDVPIMIISNINVHKHKFIMNNPGIVEVFEFGRLIKSGVVLGVTCILVFNNDINTLLKYDLLSDNSTNILTAWDIVNNPFVCSKAYVVLLLKTWFSYGICDFKNEQMLDEFFKLLSKNVKQENLPIELLYSFYAVNNMHSGVINPIEIKMIDVAWVHGYIEVLEIIADHHGLKGGWKSVLNDPEILSKYHIFKVNEITDGKLSCGWKFNDGFSSRFISLNELGYILEDDKLTFKKISIIEENVLDLNPKHKVTKLHKEMLPPLKKIFSQDSAKSKNFEKNYKNKKSKK
jgi:hypothetical protein